MQKITNFIENKKNLAHRNFSIPTHILGNVSNFKIKQQKKNVYCQNFSLRGDFR